MPTVKAVSAFGRRLLNERTRLLPYMAVGGAFAGITGGAIAARITRADLEATFVVAFAVGIASGMAAGWALLTLGSRRHPPASAIGMQAMRLALALPAYAVAGVAAGMAVNVVAGRGPDVAETLRGVLTALAAFGVLIIPVNLALARRGARPALEARTFPESVIETLAGGTAARTEASRRTSVIAIAGVAWMIISGFLVLALHIGLHAIAPDAYATLRDRYPGLGTAVMVGWIVVVLAGVRFIAGRVRTWGRPGS